MHAETVAQSENAYEFTTRIRYSEADHRGLATVPAIINLFQDCSTFQSEALGLGMERLKREQHAWVLTHWHLVIDRYPAIGEEVAVGTFATRFRGLTANRSFYLRDTAGDLVARANTSWAFMDLATGRPCRPTPEHTAPYGQHEPLDMPEEARRVALPGAAETTTGAAIPVRRHHIDTNEHVNNGQYVAVALDLAPAELHPGQVRVDFKRSAVLGDVFRPAIAADEERIVVVLGDDADPAATPFAVVEFRP